MLTVFLVIIAFRELCARKLKKEKKNKKPYAAAMKCQVKKFEKYMELYKAYGASDGAWLADAMAVLILETRMLAKHADIEAKDADNSNLVNTKELLDSCFRFTMMVSSY